MNDTPHMQSNQTYTRDAIPTIKDEEKLIGYVTPIEHLFEYLSLLNQ